MQTYHHKHPFELESGARLPELTIAYHTYGHLNAEKSNVIWVCHALTANSDVFDWWAGLFGESSLFNPNDHFIVCANVLGSCYGSTGALSENPQTQKPYGHDFPVLTVRDLVQAHKLLKTHLEIEKIHTMLGCSLGGMQALEWAFELGTELRHLMLFATNAQSSPWLIAFNESQRWAIENDPTWQTDSPKAGIEGMKIARSIALLSYRHYITYANTQSEDTNEKTTDFRACSYQRYQGQKLADRFNAYAYWHLSKIMDSHNIGRGRDTVTEALQKVQAQTLVVGMPTDLLFPIEEQIFLAKHIPHAMFASLESGYGHDGFLIEKEKLSQIITHFYEDNSLKKL